MRTRPLRAGLVAVASVAATALVGCSGDDRGGSGDVTIGPTPAPGDEPAGEQVELIDTGVSLDEPVTLEPAPTGGALLVAQRGGLVRQLDPDGDQLVARDEPVIDVTELVGSTESERGLLGLAVAPDGRHLYLSYTAADDGASQLDEFVLTRVGERWTADPATRRNLVDVDQPFPNHNGGHIAFGPDGMLYLGLGDGGAGGDPEGNAQDPTSLLGKLLRLDPSLDPPVPADNPFVGDDELGARDEIWASGLRNPWRFSFDRATGDLWIGDVGQDRTEEIDLLPAGDGAGRGANLGWDLFEGDAPFDDADPAAGGASDGPFVDPVVTYGHDEGCSVIGGVVQDGEYLFADLCGAGVRALVDDGDGGFTARQLTDAPSQIVGFAQDRAGEVLVISLSEGVFRLRR